MIIVQYIELIFQEFYMLGYIIWAAIQGALN